MKVFKKQTNKQNKIKDIKTRNGCFKFSYQYHTKQHFVIELKQSNVLFNFGSIVNKARILRYLQNAL